MLFEYNPLSLNKAGYANLRASNNNKAIRQRPSRNFQNSSISVYNCEN